jgi:IclR family transcriptional regulator, acetate operon repressor
LLATLRSVTDETPFGPTSRGTLGTVRNAMLLLDLLSEGAPFQQLSELAEKSGSSLPTVHRLLRSLTAAGLAEQDPESLRYGLGPELVRLSERYLMRLPVFRALAPYLVALRDATHGAVAAAVLARGCVVYVDRVDGEDPGGVFREPLRIRPALETAAGRLLAARCGVDAWRDALRAGSAHTFAIDDQKRWATVPYVVLGDDQPGQMVEVAVPVVDANGETVAGLAAIGRADRFAGDAIAHLVIPQLQRAAAAGSRALAHG